MNFPKLWYTKYNKNKEFRNILNLITEAHGYKIDDQYHFKSDEFYILRTSTIDNSDILCFSVNRSEVKELLKKRNFVELKIEDILKL